MIIVKRKKLCYCKYAIFSLQYLILFLHIYSSIHCSMESFNEILARGPTVLVLKAVRKKSVSRDCSLEFLASMFEKSIQATRSSDKVFLKLFIYCLVKSYKYKIFISCFLSLYQFVLPKLTTVNVLITCRH